MAGRKQQGRTRTKTTTPRVRRTRTTAREAHYRSPQSEPASTSHHPPTAPSSPSEWYRREKERRANRAGPEGRDLIEEARQEFLALLASEAGTPKGGRPRKNPVTGRGPGRPKRVVTESETEPGAEE